MSWTNSVSSLVRSINSLTRWHKRQKKEYFPVQYGAAAVNTSLIRENGTISKELKIFFISWVYEGQTLEIRSFRSFKTDVAFFVTNSNLQTIICSMTVAHKIRGYPVRNPARGSAR